ncbi:hypothetical protein Peur_052872 [Populus x canadensis]
MEEIQSPNHGNIIILITYYRKLNIYVGFFLNFIIYDKIDKSKNMRVGIRSKKARKLIEDTFKIADSPKTKLILF